MGFKISITIIGICVGGFSIYKFIKLFLNERHLSKLTKKQSFYVYLTLILTALILGIVSIINFSNESQIEVSVNTENPKEDSLNEHVENKSLKTNEDTKINNSELNIKKVKELLDIKDFVNARKVIDSIPDSNDYIIELKRNYEIPIFMSENKYYEAIELVCQKYLNEPETSFKYRWDLAYLIYYMYINNDLEFTINVIDELKKIYTNKDLSYVWLAISPIDLDNLLNYGFRDEYNKESKSYELLDFVITNYTNDTFIDHALYFQGKYDEILNYHKNSLIYDRALYAKANKKYKEINKHEGVFSSTDTEKYSSLFFDFLDKYQNSYLSQYAIMKITNIYSIYFKYNNDYTYFIKFINYLEELKFTDKLYKEKILNIVVSKLSENISNSELYYDLTKDYSILEQHEIFKKSLIISSARSAFNNRNFDIAEKLYDKLEIEYLNDSDITNLKVSKEVNSKNLISDKYNYNNYLSLGFLMKSNKKLNHASYYFTKILESTELTTENRSKTLMLLAFSYRDLHRYEEMLEVYKEVAYDLELNKFTDDAITEIGVYYLLVKKEYSLSREYFDFVTNKYKGYNAENNAYNWIAWSYLKENDYDNALKAYTELIEKFPTNRFGINARLNISKINSVLKDSKKKFKNNTGIELPSNSKILKVLDSFDEFVMEIDIEQDKLWELKKIQLDGFSEIKWGGILKNLNTVKTLRSEYEPYNDYVEYRTSLTSINDIQIIIYDNALKKIWFIII